MKRIWLASFGLLAACGAGGFGNPGDDDGGTDAPSGCTTFISFDPVTAEASPDGRVRATAHVEPKFSPQYFWTIQFEHGPPLDQMMEQADNSEVSFGIAEAGVYNIALHVEQGGPTCFDTILDYTVSKPTANKVDYRLHVTPPLGVDAPPLDRAVQVKGGGNASLNDITLDPGVLANGTVKSGTTPVPAYLRFIPQAGRDGVVEAFSGANGAFAARVLNESHDVLIVPSIAGVVPRLIRDWSPAQTTLVIDNGTPIAGFVRDASNAPIAGAIVRATVIQTFGAGPTASSVEVPSSLATTSATGAFTVRAVPVSGALVRFDVTPPAGSGLARLSASSSTFDLMQSVQIQYGNATLRDLAGTTVRRGGAAVANAKVTVTGTLAAAASVGTVQAGTTTANASGEVRIVATANGSGVLPATKVPALALSAVVQVSAGDFAVAGFDATASVPATIDAPAMVQVTPTIQLSDATTAAKGAVVDLVPVGPLALAGAPLVHGVSDATGAVALRVAAGGSYDIRVSDPFNRGASHTTNSVATAAIATAYPLDPQVTISGTLLLAPSAQRIGNASVQLLCATCSGVARSRPVGETSSKSDGTFGVAVPDPGTPQ